MGVNLSISVTTDELARMGTGRGSLFRKVQFRWRKVGFQLVGMNLESSVGYLKVKNIKCKSQLPHDTMWPQPTITKRPSTALELPNYERTLPFGHNGGLFL